MAGTELKRYHIKPGTWDEFLEILRAIALVRIRHGFRVLFTFADRENNIFTWAVQHDGDFDAAAAAYYADPQRVELEKVGNFVTDHEIRKVEVLQIP